MRDRADPHARARGLDRSSVSANRYLSGAGRRRDPGRPRLDRGHLPECPPDYPSVMPVCLRPGPGRASGLLPIAFSPAPSGFLRLEIFLEGFQFGLDSAGPLRMLRLSHIQDRLRLIDRLLPAFALLLPRGLFLASSARCAVSPVRRQELPSALPPCRWGGRVTSSPCCLWTLRAGFCRCRCCYRDSWGVRPAR